MKKTIMAITLASLVFPCVAIAWTPGGDGGNVEIGGDVIVQPYSTAWQIKVGDMQNFGDMIINTPSKKIDLDVTKPILVLGIRQKTNDFFQGGTELNPNIDFNGAVNIDGFNDGVTTLTLPLISADDQTTKIGELTAPLYAGAAVNHSSLGLDERQYSLIAPNANNAFTGGLPKVASGTHSAQQIITNVKNLDPEVTLNYRKGPEHHDQGIAINFPGSESKNKYMVFYGAGIHAGQKITLNMNSEVSDAAVKWKASMPITISYR